MKRILTVSLLLAAGYFATGYLFITGANQNISFAMLLALLIGTIYTAIQVQKLELPRLKTLAISITLVSVLFFCFYLGLHS